MGESPGAAWAYSDLRVLSPAREEDSPAPDLIAGYVRQAGTDLQFRLDLLDLPLEPNSDLYLALDTLPSGNQFLPIDAPPGRAWDWLLVAPLKGQPALYRFEPITPSPAVNPTSSGDPQPLSPLRSEGAEKQVQKVPPSRLEGWSLQTDVIPRLVRDPWNDFIVVSFNRNPGLNLPAGFYAQAFLTSPGERVLYDSLPAFHSQSQPPGNARALLAFWNAFPAATPAQALRRWDGAHIGPLGGRHGLHVLLQAARHNDIPLTLLDLKTAASLSALDTVGGLNLVKSLTGGGLLELPDVLPGWPGMESQDAAVVTIDPAQAASASRQAGLSFGLNSGRLLYAPSLPDTPLPGYRAVFTPLGSTVSVRWQQATLIPVPQLDPTNPQASPDGLTLPTRRALLQLALSRNPNPLLLGGDLAGSTWGAAPAAEPSLRYLAAHPWIQPLSGDDLVGLHRSEELKDRRAVQEGVPGLFPGLSSALAKSGLSDPLAAAAFETALALQAPLPPQAPGLLKMRAGYADLVGGLLAGSRWAQKPTSLSDCTSDPDLDGTAECVLASPSSFALLEPEGGCLVFLFVRDFAGIHQAVAPSAQFIAGLSDPTEWQPGAGAASDPGALPGAFGGPPPWPIYAAASEPGRVVFTSPDGSVTKAYTLTDTGIDVEIRSTEPVNLQIPLGLDPWTRFTPDWSQRYMGTQNPHRVTWSLIDGPQVEVQSSGFLSLIAFRDSLDEPPVHENPNFDYPPGHYLPFPLAVVGIEADGSLSVEITLNP